MRAVVCHQHQLAVEEIPEPEPAEGQVVLEVVRCGICGSDLHSRQHADDLADVLTGIGYDDYMRADHSVVMGHEVYGVIAEHGPATQRTLPVGTPVVTLPLVRSASAGTHAFGLSARAPGGYAERVVAQEVLTLAVPNGLAPGTAALTEPMAVAWHAIARSEVKRGELAVVLGCGPVGLAVIALLKSRGVDKVVASDLSPGRRALATALGADVVVDPRAVSPFAGSSALGHFTTMAGPIDAALDAVQDLSKLPLGWWHTWRALDKLGVTTPKAPVVFECVGVPGMIDRVLADVPLYSRVVVVGVCMGSDQLRPSLGINKEIDLRFVVGYTPLEFRDTLRALSEGEVDPSPMLTGLVGLDGVQNAFDALGDPEAHAKILIDPAAAGSQVRQA